MNMHARTAGNVKKLLLALVAAAFFMTLASPAQADHGTEGTVTLAGVELCSEDGDSANDGKCTWVATDGNGWAGTGPFTISWTTADGVEDSVTCDAGAYCQSDDPDPIPAGSTVISDGTGGGSFAAGDADGHDNG